MNEEISFEEFEKLPETREAAREKSKSKRKKEPLKSPNDLISKFDEAHRNFYNNKDEPFWNFHEGPPLYFHRRTVEVFRNIRQEADFSYAKLLANEQFLEYLYATLTAWGMNELRGGAKLVNFDDFRRALQTPDLIKLLDELRDYRIETLSDENVQILKKAIKRIYSLFERKAKVMRSGRALIGTAKTLHHLQPDLLPLIDNEYILNRLGITYKDNFETYWKVFGQIRRIALQKKDFSTYRERMDTSIPKIIDNALIGYS